MGGKSLGVIMTDGAQWTGQRNFTVKQLKNFGFGKRGMEDIVIKQANDLVEHIKSVGDIVKVNGELFAVPVLNVLWDMVAGYAFDRNDEDLQKLLELNNFIFTSKLFVIATVAPWVRFIFPSLTGYNKRLEALRVMRGHIRKEIKKHELDLDENNPRDFIDSYLIEIKKNTDPEFCEEQLIMVGFDLMAAGSETTSSTLVWVILFLSLHTEVQDRCYKEIEENIGHSNVTLEDTANLNFCQATIAEIQRVGQVAVSSLQHRVLKDVCSTFVHR
jgi:methyl farnesoate epoxidase/farnesoate epoxidase